MVVETETTFNKKLGVKMDENHTYITELHLEL